MQRPPRIAHSTEGRVSALDVQPLVFREWRMEHYGPSIWRKCLGRIVAHCAKRLAEFFVAHST